MVFAQSIWECVDSSALFFRHDGRRDLQPDETQQSLFCEGGFQQTFPTELAHAFAPVDASCRIVAAISSSTCYFPTPLT